MIRTRYLAALALALCASLATAATAPAATITLSGSTSVAPLATKLAKAFVNQPQNKGKVKFVILQGGSDIGITDVARGRVTSACPRATRSRPTRAGSSSTRSPATRVCVVTNPANPIAEPQPGAGPGHLLRPDPQLERGAGRQASRARSTSSSAPPPPVPRTRSRTSSWAQTLRVAGSATTRRPPTACRRRRSSPTRTRSATRRFHFAQGLCSVPYQGVPCNLRNAKSGQYAGVRNFCLVSRGVAKGRGEEVHPVRSQRPGASALIVASDWVPLQLDERSGAPARRQPASLRTGASSSCSVRRCIVLPDRHDRLRLRQGLAVVLRTTASPGSAPAGTSTSSSRTSSTRPPTRLTTSTRCAPGRCSGARSSSPAARSLIGIVFSLFAAIFIVEFAPRRLNRVLEPVVRLLAAVPVGRSTA